MINKTKITVYTFCKPVHKVCTFWLRCAYYGGVLIPPARKDEVNHNVNNA